MACNVRHTKLPTALSYTTTQILDMSRKSMDHDTSPNSYDTPKTRIVASLISWHPSFSSCDQAKSIFPAFCPRRLACDYKLTPRQESGETRAGAAFPPYPNRLCLLSCIADEPIPLHLPARCQWQAIHDQGKKACLVS